MKSAVVLINLGTPDNPTAGSIRQFLRRFLSDPRVVEVPRPIWLLILYCFILPFRPLGLREKYQGIWKDGRSPLTWYTEKLVARLSDELGASVSGNELRVTAAMTYSDPDIPRTIDKLIAEGIEDFHFLPLYPQYSATTTGAVHDLIARHFASMRSIPRWRWTRDYYDHPLYIDALAGQVHEYWQANGRGEVLIMSFHGIPQRNVELGDPYQAQCEITARMLAEKLNLSADEWILCYQSRLGRAQWLEPYTRNVLTDFAEQKKKRVDVVCPAFAVECLETLEEIAVELADEFVEDGGEELRYIPCLNDSNAHVQLLKKLCEEA